MRRLIDLDAERDEAPDRGEEERRVDEERWRPRQADLVSGVEAGREGEGNDALYREDEDAAPVKCRTRRAACAQQPGAERGKHDDLRERGAADDPCDRKVVGLDGGGELPRRRRPRARTLRGTVREIESVRLAVQGVHLVEEGEAPVEREEQQRERACPHEDDQAAHALILSAEGKFWCNGFDLKWIQEHMDLAEALQQAVELLYARILQFPKPTLAAVNGHACAGGAMLMLAFDFRIMNVEKGFVFMPGIDLGIVYTPGRVSSQS